MAHQVNRLTDRTVRSVRTQGNHPDGNCLYLQVSPTGGKSWIYRYMVAGRSRDMGLGSLLDVTLAEARERRDAARKLLKSGVDPLDARHAPKMVAPALASAPAVPAVPKLKPAPSLLVVWKDYVAGQEAVWKGGKTKDGWMRSIESHAALIKNKPVDRIDVDDVLLVLRPLWTTKAESAGKLRDRLERVLDYARVMKYRSGDNPAVWKGNLFHLLPPRPKLQRGHMRALAYQDIPEFMRRLAAKEGVGARALEFSILTIARETMTLESTWGEIHDDLWSLEAERMKMRPFRQPLSTGALRVLDGVRPANPRPNQLLFPAPLHGGALSNTAMDKVLKDLGADATPHGMRSTFRDWAGDETDFARETIEECLAHLVGDETERAYRRSDALKKRRAVLEAWSAYCLRPA
ncbi:integrase arm-type DNA-binding domain-containing protein [Brevundimonas sp.]|uniref:tyrosine-type recombinase/integrase n=1 Tax=Brevundimonas sp. TaxID=1871086 RepID=UPI001A258A63|nr:integrase arm-type DNA-binding domain-containing protein [Brevundimonas sp.]MBJ7485276.1 integrase arm-type DNA-binding domain-containing protein [Brevundimonas sp.]